MADFQTKKMPVQNTRVCAEAYRGLDERACAPVFDISVHGILCAWLKTPYIVYVAVTEGAKR